ncbi:hypothetical protein FBU31_007949 [Coemansia sp. 'formosensis']|nr:hypothetical protein FBU31_007949 [Coemansia sp. 'formosensis']
MNLQTQRMLGQQSTAEFNGLHIDTLRVGELNSLKQGDDIKRKNNCIVNTGGKLGRDEVEKRRIKHREMFEVEEKVWKNIVLPRFDNPLVVLDRKRAELKALRAELDDVLAQLASSGDSAAQTGTKRARE